MTCPKASYFKLELGHTVYQYKSKEPVIIYIDT